MLQIPLFKEVSFGLAYAIVTEQMPLRILRIGNMIAGLEELKSKQFLRDALISSQFGKPVLWGR
jgi:hypothetical protein